MSSELQSKVFDWNEETKLEGNRAFLEFDENGQIVMKFEESEPFYVGVPEKDKFGTKKYMFKVTDHAGEPAVFSTGSKRCLSELKKFLPLTGKAVCISRAGSGVDTQYKAELI